MDNACDKKSFYSMKNSMCNLYGENFGESGFSNEIRKRYSISYDLGGKTAVSSKPRTLCIFFENSELFLGNEMVFKLHSSLPLIKTDKKPKLCYSCRDSSPYVEISIAVVCGTQIVKDCEGLLPFQVFHHSNNHRDMFAFKSVRGTVEFSLSLRLNSNTERILAHGMETPVKVAITLNFSNWPPFDAFAPEKVITFFHDYPWKDGKLVGTRVVPDSGFAGTFATLYGSNVSQLDRNGTLCWDFGTTNSGDEVKIFTSLKKEGRIGLANKISVVVPDFPYSLTEVEFPFACQLSLLTYGVDNCTCIESRAIKNFYYLSAGTYPPAKEEVALSIAEENQFEVAKWLYNQCFYRSAMFWFNQCLAKEKNTAQALYCTGMMYYKGQGVDENKIRAFHHFMLGSKMNEPYCLLTLGTMHYLGEPNGNQSNLMEALNCFVAAIQPTLDRDSIVKAKKNILYLLNEYREYFEGLENKKELLQLAEN